VCAALPGAVPPAPGLDELDAHAWDWLWWLDVKLARGEPWLVHIELVKFVETVLVFGSNALAGEWWRGATGFSADSLRAALPSSPEPDALDRALTAAVGEWEALRERLARELGMPLADELAAQVRAGRASNPRPPR
jgi:hypothetical protein